MKSPTLHFCGKCLRVLIHPVWTPEADERRFLAPLPIVMFCLMPLWGKGFLHFMGSNPILAVFALWCGAYVFKFWQRLQYRGELKRVIIALVTFLSGLLAVLFY